MRPSTEKPIDTLKDAFSRGTNILAFHSVPDPAKPEEIFTYVLDYMLNPKIKQYIKDNKIATYPLQEEGNHFQGQMMKEMMEDGASVVYAVNLNYYHN